MRREESELRKDILRETAGYLAGRRRRRTWKKVVSALACVVVFCTVYALILPALTLEKTCTPESLGLHRHTDECLNESGEYCCGYCDFVVHEHDENCYDVDGNLWCTFPEIKAHKHDENCYKKTETKPVHTHTDKCYDIEQGELICTIPEGEGAHTHSRDAGCYDEDGTLVCEIEESKGHKHTDGCYKQNKILICQLSTEAAEETAGKTLICGKEEIIPHKHDKNCYDENGSLICGKMQVLEHVHSEACFRDGKQPTETDALSGGTEEPTETDVLSGGMKKPTEADALSGETEKQTETNAASGETEEPSETSSEESEEPAARTEGSAPGRTNAPSALREAADVTVRNTGAGEASTVALWTDAEGEAKKRLQTVLFALDQGYTIRDIRFYRISGLQGGEAEVTYSGGGLDASASGAKVFVYDLGTDGRAVPENCQVADGQTIADNKFTSFSFTAPAADGASGHIYAFLSASAATLEEMGIYVGEKQDDGTWVACDAETEGEAGVKVTVTLPEGKEASEGYKLFIRKISEGENYYPTDEAVRAKAGKVNDWQCYTIRWIKQEDDGSLRMATLNSVGTTEVRIEYLKEDAKLSGPAGGRKLLIYNTKKDGSLVEQVADTVENVRVDGDKYQSFTFQAAQAGPYVFVSKKVELGYIDALKIGNVMDGSAPFDNSNAPGNDNGESNRIVRSYDTIQYNLEATFGARQEGNTATEVNMYFELTLKKSATAARFDVTKMNWLGENYSIEYLDDRGVVIMIMDHDGHYYEPRTDEDGNILRDEHGFALADYSKQVSMNAQVAGSTSDGNSYKVTSGGVAEQRMVGWTALRSKEEESILSGTKSFSMAVEVRNADNGEVFSPSFKMWLEGNEENYGPEGSEGEIMLPATPDEDNVVDISDLKNKQYQVTVSAGTNFNLQLKKNGDMSYKNWFDFSTGNVVNKETREELVRLANLPENHGRSKPEEFTENEAALSAGKQAEYKNYRYGRITCYGVTLQLYSDTDNDPNANRAAKGLKGMSLPVGDITFDLNFSSEAKSGTAGETIDPKEYTAILWDYNENVPANTTYQYTYVDPGRGKLVTPNDGKGNGRRTLYWDGEERSAYAKGGAPSNYKVYHDGCYYGGDWSILSDGEKVNSLEAMQRIASPAVVTGSGEDSTYHFSVSDYDFDFDDQHFPTKDAGNSGDVTGYDTYARCFSAGCVQVLSVFPMVQKVSEAEIFLHAEVKNLKLVTRAGQELEAQEDDPKKIKHEVNTTDNIRRDQIVLYAPGNLTKGSAFNGTYKSRDPRTISEGFLGTEYWTTSYDCSTFAGDDIWIISYGMMASGSDYRMKSMNLLQLFDSRALSIWGEPDVKQSWNSAYDKQGNATFLYAADPDYKGGYDTNKEGVLTYMNTVREEDLVYYTSLEELKRAGYTCIGVLMELRNCDLLGGKYQYMRIPVTVNGEDEDLVSKTVATVNTFRVWSYDLGTISWKNGVWNSETGKNELGEFPTPANGIVNDRYSGECANRDKKSPPPYVKTEYQDGLQKVGTHAGGTLAGNSLLILSYKANIDIGIDNKATEGKITYNLGNGETLVDYRLRNIRTDISDPTSQGDRPLTTLTITATLDAGKTGGDTRISVSGGSYRMRGYAVEPNGTVSSEETDIVIGSDPMNPTCLAYTGTNGKQYRIKVYAQRSSDGKSVQFVIADAPVGLALPDITFQANLNTAALENNDSISARAEIGGEGDHRAYAEAKGNQSNVTAYIVMLSSTNLTKSVNTQYIELNGTITYTVLYTNSGSDTIGKIYFYDLLPHKDDIRGSDFAGDVILRSFNVTSQNSEDTPEADPADATIYYSTTDYNELYDTVKVFGGTVESDGKISGMSASKVEDMLASGENEANEQLFQVLGKVENGTFAYDSKLTDMGYGLTDLMSQVTGLYAKVESLRKGQTIEMTFTIQTGDNKAGDWYKNIANSWIAGSATLPLTSNKVETQAISRSISGVVWHDRNLNGIRDDGEQLLGGVTATLFKKAENGSYEVCETDVTKESITPAETGADGAYAFGKLGPGNYLVAFSGESLKKFTGATGYQQTGGNRANTSDGVKNDRGTNKANLPEGYDYYIQYSIEDESMPLHSLKDIAGGKVSLVNGVESHANQDLGLIIATHELPQTGGPGTTLYTIGGLLLLIAAGLLLLYRKNKCGKEDFASS